MKEPLAKKDDNRGQVYQDPIAKVNAYLARFGDEVGAELGELDGDGYTDVRHGDLRVGINVLRKPGLLMLLVKMAECPQEPARALALYRQLLELNFLTTQGASFAVDDARDAVYLRVSYDLSELDYPRFRALLLHTVSVAEDVRTRLHDRNDGS